MLVLEVVGGDGAQSAVFVNRRLAVASNAYGLLLKMPISWREKDDFTMNRSTASGGWSCGCTGSTLSWTRGPSPTSLERALLSALHKGCADKDVRVVVFAGSGRSFSDGWDLGETELTAPAHHPLSAWAGRHTWRRSCECCAGRTSS